MLALLGSSREDVLVWVLSRCWLVAHALMAFPVPALCNGVTPRNCLTTSGARAVLVSCGSAP